MIRAEERIKPYLPRKPRASGDDPPAKGSAITPGG